MTTNRHPRHLSQHGRSSTWVPLSYDPDLEAGFRPHKSRGSNASNDSGGDDRGGGGGGGTFNPMQGRGLSSYGANSRRLGDADRQSTLDELHMSDEDEVHEVGSALGHTKAT